MSDFKYNILLIVTSQESAQFRLPDGVTLPNRAELKKDGISFSNYFTASPHPTSARNALYTGQHALMTGLTDDISIPYIHDLPPETVTLGQVMRDAGYYTAYKGLWGLSHIADGDSSSALEAYGFSDFNATGDYNTEIRGGYDHDPEIAQSAVDWLKHKGATLNKPFLLAVNFINPHDIKFFDSDGVTGPVQTSEDYVILDPPDDPLYQVVHDLPLPANFYDDLSQKPAAQKGFSELADRLYGTIPKDRLDMWKAHRSYYLNCLRDSDRHIGTVLKAVHDLKMSKNTIIVFTSDYSELGGAHGLRQNGNLAYHEAVNVPFIIVHPDFAGGRETPALASSLDLVPTMMAFAGYSNDDRNARYPKLKGHELSHVVEHPDSYHPRDTRGILVTWDSFALNDPQWQIHLSQVRHEQTGTLHKLSDYLMHVGTPDRHKRGLYRAIFDGRYKFVRYFSPDDYAQAHNLETLLEHNDLELYDTQSDPSELNNLAHSSSPDYNPELIQTMNEHLKRLIAFELGEDTAPHSHPVSEMLIDTVSDKVHRWQIKWLSRH